MIRIDDRKAALANGSAPISGKQWTSIRRVCLLACSRRSIGWRQASSTVQARMDQMISTANHDELRKSLEALTDGIQLLGGKQLQISLSLPRYGTALNELSKTSGTCFGRRQTG